MLVDCRTFRSFAQPERWGRECQSCSRDGGRLRTTLSEHGTQYSVASPSRRPQVAGARNHPQPYKRDPGVGQCPTLENRASHPPARPAVLHSISLVRDLHSRPDPCHNERFRDHYPPQVAKSGTCEYVTLNHDVISRSGPWVQAISTELRPTQDQGAP